MRIVPWLALIASFGLLGCASAETGTPSSEDKGLAPPPPGSGIQVRMTSTLDPGQEIERCQLLTVPPEGLYIHTEETRFTPGSHHVVLWRTAYTQMPTENRHGVALDPTEIHDCTRGAGYDWEINGMLAGSQTSDGAGFLDNLPEGVAIPVEPGAILVMNTHYLNASPKPIEADARINLWTIPKEDVQTEAGIFFFYDPFIRVPANGDATARMRCPVDKDISLVSLQSHMHRRGVSSAASLTDESGAKLEEIYTSADWENVTVAQFTPPLTIQAGHGIDYECHYKNPESHDVLQGLSTEDEMCVLLGSYFPRDPMLDNCLDSSGEPAETIIGSGTASCTETLNCIANASPNDDHDAILNGCVVDSCPGAAKEVSALLACQMTLGHGACDTTCDTTPNDCTSCLLTACSSAVDACMQASCGP